ncbi:hypothetical protein [[Limnothrix rosea] IAM M-220]|uniref:hypothetical protein n=1 Tax=[Limnothrix rosea] IAM M-220 TaxID=454133 RepID=UPI001115A4AF|nr:hypothetical protein [[Limnothrix rosea] IAM M-220]
MKQAPFFATLVNGASLVLLGIWGYLDSGSPTAFIPVGLGLGFFVLSPGVKSYNKAIRPYCCVPCFSHLSRFNSTFLAGAQ